MTTFAPSLRPIDYAVSAVTDGVDVASLQQRARRLARMALVLCIGVHIWLISAGHWAYWPQYTARYDLLAKGFAAGQTNLPIHANVRHLALPDPYDPVANEPFRMKPGIPDSCLYNGKFYLYWGPVPSLLLVPVKAVLGRHVMIGDQYLTFAFVVGMMLATAGLLLRLRARHFPASPAWLPAVGIAVAGLSTPIACVMTRSAIYEAAIVGGQCFLLSGIYFAWCGITRHRLRPTGIPSEGSGERLPRSCDCAGVLALFAAGLCLALAVGCRVSLAVAVAGVAFLVAARIAIGLRHHDRWNAVIARLLAVGLPLVAGALALGWYNHARFGSWMEFGQKYQLAGVNLRSYPSLFGIANLYPGLWSYFIRPVAIVDQFPFLMAVPGDGTFPSFITLPKHYESYEPITGLVWVMPMLWLLPIAMLFTIVRAGRQRLGRRGPSSLWEQAGVREDVELRGLATDTRDDLRWLVGTLVIAALLGFAPILLMIGSSQRYLADLTPPLVIVAMVVLWRLTDAQRTRPKSARRWLALGVSLAGVSIVLGLLTSIEGYAGHFRFFNPVLFRKLSGGGGQAKTPADAPYLSHDSSLERPTHVDA